MEGGQEMQEFYSSTSSDDQSSINSVIRVGGSGMDTSESDSSAPTTPLRTTNRMLSDECESYDCEEEDDHDLNCNHTGDLSTTDSEDDVEERLRQEGHVDSDDSTSSEETQIIIFDLKDYLASLVILSEVEVQ
ncbi:hypothetical protein CAPTEDRAFT_216694 [Capitella teleta]|uniref:Uncharacterized protein n=1 Tax=Capitella teleta TaxID=283909 RepID=R7T6C7_CAPTE|nr:hypothetical protein CAPTEDRAFT_216694 [Capitella teleta]|eukprot:ELT89104.1 hypothetical protein CAPTEDRAFT_216694 [Capitella teleta]